MGAKTRRDRKRVAVNIQKYLSATLFQHYYKNCYIRRSTKTLLVRCVGNRNDRNADVIIGGGRTINREDAAEVEMRRGGSVGIQRHVLALLRIEVVRRTVRIDPAGRRSVVVHMDHAVAVG